MLKKYRVALILFALSVLLGAAPLALALSADSIASFYGCTLHEGYTNPCVIWGADRGETLYRMFVMGWLSLVTIPFGVLGACLALFTAIGTFFYERRNRVDPGAPPTAGSS